MIMIAGRSPQGRHSVPQDRSYENEFYASDQDQQKLRNSMSPRRQRLEHHEQNEFMHAWNSPRATLIASEANPATNFILTKANDLI